MQKRHTNRERYFEEQAQTTRNYYIPYIKEYTGILEDFYNHFISKQF